MIVTALTALNGFKKNAVNIGKLDDKKCISIFFVSFKHNKLKLKPAFFTYFSPKKFKIDLKIFLSYFVSLFTNIRSNNHIIIITK